MALLCHLKCLMNKFQCVGFPIFFVASVMVRCGVFLLLKFSVPQGEDKMQEYEIQCP